MEKLKGYGAVILPFLVAFVIQIIFAMMFMFLYGIIKVFQLVSSGAAINSTIIETMVNQVVTELSVPISAFTAVISLVIFGIWYKKICQKEIEQYDKHNLKFKVIIGIILLGIGLQISLSFILNVIASLKPQWFTEYSEVMDKLVMKNSIISVLYIGIIAPLCEEFIFRGVIFKKAQKAMPYIVANIIQALMFGIYHGVLIQGIYAFLLGMFLGVVCYKKKTIFAAIGLHMVINMSGLVFTHLDTYDFSVFTKFVFLIPVVGFGALICGMAIILKKDKSSEELY